MEIDHRRRRFGSLFVVLVIVGLLLISVIYIASAATPIYIRPGGDDTNCNGEHDVDYSGGVAPNCAVQTIQKGIDLVDAGGTVYIRTGTYVLSSAVNVNKANITLAGSGTTSTIIQVSGTGYRFNINSAGVTLQDLQIEKTDKIGVQNIIFIGADDITIKDNLIFGQFVVGDGEVTRAFEVAYGTTGWLVDGNTIHSLRQPGYVNGSLANPTSGNIQNNDVYGTKGWVIDGANLTFTNNTWGTGNVFDVAILSTTDASYYPDIVAISEANNDAVIEDQRVSPAVLSVVYVDDDAAGGGDGGELHPYQTIAPAVTRVVSGGKIFVDAGTYNERLNINKSLRLRGAQYGVDPTQSGARTNPANESIITEVGLSTPNPDVLIEISSGVNNVDVNGFTLIGDPTNPTADTTVVRAWGDNINIQDNIVDGLKGVLYKGTGTGLDISENRMTVNKNGLVVQSGISNLTVSGNSFSLGSSPAGDEAAAYITSCNTCNFTNNTATNFSGRGIGGSSNSNITITGNTLTNNKDGVSIWGNSTNILIDNNDLSNSSRYGINIKGQDIDITNNVIDNCLDSGINIDYHVIDTQNVDIHYNQISGNTNYGIFVGSSVTDLVDAEYNWWGDATGPYTNDVKHSELNPHGVSAGGDKASGEVDVIPWHATSTTTAATQFVTTTHNPIIAVSDTIKGAVDAALSGDIVSASSGTYNEQQIIIDKDITINGAGKALTIVTPVADTGSSGDARGWIVVNATGSLSLNDLTMDGTGYKVYQAVRDYGTGSSITNVNFKEIKFNESGPTYAGVGVAAFGSGPVDMSGSDFSAIGRVGVLYYGTGVSGSTFDNNTYSGKGPGDWLDYALDISAGADVTVTNNIISGNRGVASSDGSTSAGILVTTYYASTTSSWIENNTISDSTTGIHVGYDGTDTSQVQAHNNCIEGNDTGVYSTAPFVDAEENWWDDASGPYHATTNPSGLGDPVGDFVDYEPWISDACGGSATSGNWQNQRTSVYSDLQTSLDEAISGDEIKFVGTGSGTGGAVTSVGGVTINLNGGTFIPGSPFLTVSSPDITLIGPGTLDGGGSSDPGILITSGGDNFILENVEITDWEDGLQVDSSVESLKIVGNWIHRNADAGVQIDSGVTLDGIVTIEGNLFKENTSFGMNNLSGNIVPAVYNSWGALSGPYNATYNPSGTGNAVSDDISFSPWTFAEIFMDVDPDTLAITHSVNEDDSFDVKLKADAEKLYGLTFEFTYDTSLLTLNSTTFSSPWDGAGVCTSLSSTAGVVSFRCNLSSGPEWDVSAGTIATFNFTADLPGIGSGDAGPWSAYFDIDPDPAKTSAAAKGGIKVFVDNAGYDNPSSSQRDITNTSPPYDGQIDITGTPEYDGYIDLQGRTNDSGGVMEVYNQASTTSPTKLSEGTSVSSGKYATDYLSSPLVLLTTYYLQADAPLYLPTTALNPLAPNFAQSKQLTTRPFTRLGKVVLLGGDATDNDVIDVLDASCIGGRYGLTPAACGSGGSSDVNADGLMDILDLTLMGGNYGLNSSSPWIP